MTPERYTLEEWGLNFIVNDNGRNLTAKQTVTRLNAHYEDTQRLKKDVSRLNKVNKELKSKVDDKEVAVEVETEKLMNKVFSLIDEKLGEARLAFQTKGYKSYYSGRIDALEELRKEVSE